MDITCCVGCVAVDGDVVLFGVGSGDVGFVDVWDGGAIDVAGGFVDELRETSRDLVVLVVSGWSTTVVLSVTVVITIRINKLVIIQF